MQIRPVQPRDLDLLSEIDGTVESSQYLHVERTGEGLGSAWRLHERPLRERLVRSNPIDDDAGSSSSRSSPAATTGWP